MRRFRLAMLSLVALATLSTACSKSNPAAGPGDSPTAQNVLPQKQPKPLDLAFIPSDSILYLAADPYQLLNSPNLRSLNLAQLVPGFRTDYGIDLNNVEQLVLAGGLLKGRGDPYWYGVVVRYKSPVNREELLAIAAPGAETVADEQGREYARSGGEGGGCVYIASDKVVVLAREPALGMMLGADGGASPMIDRLKSLDDASAVVAAFNMDALRGPLKGFMALGAIKRPAPPFDALMTVADNLSMATLRMEVTPALSTRANLHGKDPAAAAQMATAADQLVAAVTKSFDDEIARYQRESVPPGQREATILKLAFQNFMSGTTRKADGSDYVVVVDENGLQSPLTLVGGRVVNDMAQEFERGRQRHIAERMSQIADAMVEFAERNGALPAPASVDASGRPLLSWRVQILPFVGEQALYEQFTLDEPWDSEHNRALIARMPDVFKTPGKDAGAGVTSFLMPTGPETIFVNNTGPALSDLGAKPEETIILVLSPSEEVEWTKPADHAFAAQSSVPSLSLNSRLDLVAGFANGKARVVEALNEGQRLLPMFAGRAIPPEQPAPSADSPSQPTP